MKSIKHAFKQRDNQPLMVSSFAVTAKKGT